MTQYGGTGYENRGSIGGSARGGYGGSNEGLMGGGWATLLCGMAAGAALMDFPDPDRGGRRRAPLPDKGGGGANDRGGAAGKRARDRAKPRARLVPRAGGPP